MCGEAVPPRARACPHCGADERTGWDADATRYDGLELPDSAFDDETTPRRTPARRTATGVPVITWWIAAGLLVLVTLRVVRGGW